MTDICDSPELRPMFVNPLDSAIAVDAETVIPYDKIKEHDKHRNFFKYEFISDT